ncbi:TraR/DksA family transcriptional regulator [Neptuniibacter sp.]|uniref:TraR/DksA family transcriptional regulator n=1 Tax=Neptuniibacter sp. TaxID=1962643 RepID=UPI00261D1480|nr:TraR/DksA family transcriptional regulator [Neptuniibacter sp.]MCP4598583.1 TraR/DksA family transcriptional regulator [Neptuniibacter sp.]
MTASLSLSEVASFKNELQRLLEQLQTEVGEELEQQVHPDINQSTVHDTGDDAEASVELMLSVETLARHSDEVAECLAALKRIETGDFGCCTDCGEEIELSRLKACPTASRCIRCQSVHETGLQQSA